MRGMEKKNNEERNEMKKSGNGSQLQAVQKKN